MRMIIVIDLIVAAVMVGLAITLLHSLVGCGTYRSNAPLGCWKTSSDYAEGKACHAQD